MVDCKVDWPAGALTRAGHLNLHIILVAFTIKLYVHLVKHFMILGLADGVTLSDRVEFFEKHRLNRLSSEMEQDCPCFRYITFIDIHEVKLVDI